MTPDRRKNRQHAYQDSLDQLLQDGQSLDSALEQYPQHVRGLKE